MGLVPTSSTGRDQRLEGTAAIGHNRYSTTGSTTLKNCQPLVVEYARGGLAIAHNGNLVNFAELRERLEANGSIFQSSSDSEVIIHLIAGSHAPTLAERVIEALAQVSGAYSLLLLTERELIAVRDPLGFRPLVLGSLNGAPIVASETCALDLIAPSTCARSSRARSSSSTTTACARCSPFPPRRAEALHLRVRLLRAARQPALRPQRLRGAQAAGPRARARMAGRGGRRRPGARLGRPAALGFAEQSGLPFEMGLIRSHYVGRTFIEPQQSIRHFGVRLKLNPVGAAARQARRRRRRLDRARHHARARSSRWCARPARARCTCASRPADAPTLLLRHRHADPRGAHRVEPLGRGDPPLRHRGLARVSELGRPLLVPWRPREGFCDACFTGKYPVEIPTNQGRISCICSRPATARSAAEAHRSSLRRRVGLAHDTERARERDVVP